MIKLRDAGYCNLKLLLILSVVYGHWIEPWIWDAPVLLEQYRLIYLVHMPLFSFLSGLFLTGEKGCRRCCGRSLGLYVLCQSVAAAMCGESAKWHTPVWHLWYLLSLGCWSALGWVWFRLAKGKGGGLVLALGVAAGCLAGYVPWLSRVMSGSRTVVFFPYFWLGLMVKPGLSRKKLRISGLIGLGAALAGLVWLRARTPVSFLYHAAPFGALEQGALARLVCYGTGLGFGLFLLAWTPGRRGPFTRIGADTLGVYLFHGPLVAALRLRELPLWGYLPAAGALVVCLELVLRWNNGFYGIVPEERRRFGWRPWEKHTSNTEKGYSGSCCP